MGSKRMTAPARRAQLIEVARDCFAENGFPHTTTAMIAQRADVTEPVLYQHFQSKLDLFHAILECSFEHAMEHFRRIAESGDTAADRLVSIMEAMPAYTREHGRTFRVIDRALASASDPKSGELLREYYRTFVAKLCRLVEDGRTDGSIRADADPEALAWFLVMTNVGYRLVRGLGIESLESPAFQGQLAALVRNLVEPCRDGDGHSKA